MIKKKKDEIGYLYEMMAFSNRYKNRKNKILLI